MSLAESWAQQPGDGERRFAQHLAVGFLAVRSTQLWTCSPQVKTARSRFWCREALAAGTPRLQTRLVFLLIGSHGVDVLKF